MKKFALLLSFLFSLGLFSQNIDKVEYYFDIDPGLGNATALPFSSNGDTSLVQQCLPTDDLDLGFHTLFVRAKDEDGIWSMVEKFAFLLEDSIADQTEIKPLVHAEFFFDEDPGFGNGFPLSPLEINNDTLSFDGDILAYGICASGFHTVFVRVQDLEGIWSNVQYFRYYFDLQDINYNIVPFNMCCRPSIPIDQGWNMISINCMPNDSSLENIYAPISENIIQVKNLTGTYVPSFGFNSIGNWQLTEGYQVKSTIDTLLEFEAAPIEPETIPIELNQGWNLISYLPKTAASPLTVFAEIKNDIIQVKNLTGTYVPSFGDFNSIGNLEPYQAYLIKMNKDTTFYYQANQ